MSENFHILIVDDEQEICQVVQGYLTEEGYRVSAARDGAEMRRIVGESTVDIVLLDVVLPREDGLTLARWLRDQNANIGIIMLTGRRDTMDRIIGLELGADDYLPKPFHLRELLARVRSVGRRIAPAAAEVPSANRLQARFADWLLDRASRALLSPDGEPVRLTSGEFELLATFIAHANQVLSRDRLLELVRGREAGPFDRTIDVQVGRLRRKLNDSPLQPQLIKTIRGGGYLFAAPVEWVEPKAAVADGSGPTTPPYAAYCTSAPGAGQ